MKGDFSKNNDLLFSFKEMPNIAWVVGGELGL